jgi:hypothetical protein
MHHPTWRRRSAASGPSFASGRGAVWPGASLAWRTPLAAVPRACFPPAVAIHVVRLACKRPDTLGRSRSQGDGAELARQLMAAELVEAIAVATVRRLLASHQLTPWRPHRWLSPTHPRDAACYATVSELIDRYTRPRRDDERVLSVDAKTSWPPRCRVHPTQPAQPGNMPTRHAHDYTRGGALNVCAAFDTRSGQVLGQGSPRQRQQEFMTVLEPLDLEIAHHIKTMHSVCDQVRTHHGTDVRKWIATHSRVVLHFTPVHCSWMKQGEQWFSILQRKRLRIADFESKEHLQAKLSQCICAWHQHAHPFNWSTKSVAKVMAKAPAIAA